MNCDGVSNLLSAYLDGELTPGELLRVEEHLRRCHACADEVDSLRQTIALVTSLEEVEVPATFQLQLHQRLVALGPVPAVRRAPAAASWQKKVGRWAVPAAAAAAALAVGLTTFNPGDPLKGLSGVSTFRGEQVQTKQNSDTPQEEVNPGPGPGTGTGTEIVTQPPVNTTSNKPDTSSDKPVDVTAGPTNRGDNPGTATPTDQPVQPKLQPKMAYSANLKVAGALDQKTVDALKSQYTRVDVVDNTVIVTVTPGSFEQVLERLQKTYWPTAVREYANRDLATELQKAEAKLAAATHQLEQLKKQPEADLTAAQAEVDEAQANFDLMTADTNKATIVVTFK